MKCAGYDAAPSRTMGVALSAASRVAAAEARCVRCARHLVFIAIYDAYQSPGQYVLCTVQILRFDCACLRELRLNSIISRYSGTLASI